MNLRYLAGAAVLWIAMPVGYTSAQDNGEREITLVGCVMRESQYRNSDPVPVVRARHVLVHPEHR